MGARGRRGYIKGLEALSAGFQALGERRRQALLDALERERFEFAKQKAKEQAEEDKRDRVIRIREGLLDRGLRLKQLEEGAAAKRRSGIMGARDKMIGRFLQQEGLNIQRDREERLLRSLMEREQPEPTEEDKFTARLNSLRKFEQGSVLGVPERSMLEVDPILSGIGARRGLPTAGMGVVSQPDLAGQEAARRKARGEFGALYPGADVLPGSKEPEPPESEDDDLAAREEETLTLFSSIMDKEGIGKPRQRTFTPEAKEWLTIYAQARSADRSRMLSTLKDRNGRWDKSALRKMLVEQNAF